ncbi:16S rRNA (guanine(966)-N(2))-methyltransferase RsmD [Waterburya agarophytonicola K14]|uniref:16S rRNA (Guanine(966)-N(2))-methyltransferase RsmD n=1 Tax=Waterburya agarophytonicola KI4 TaxID=2874699 RepID=A0A964FFF8_9CYAN|nr:16S rRNA (guanine(966)-N(2))-methyltransferase RsmD [Waterburya agarophytonicola]MCC0177715.1 16S rRNA (guanine(966)-N(2))-methyltransferase RsmD [Waterburya agarophytonicola KI4]
MRIYGNRQLKTLPGQKTRPTAARVREALFNIWRDRIADCRWLDLCAGNGSMGAEALCRGASKVVGIEKYSKACSIIEQNWQTIARPEQSFQVIKGDVLVKIKALEGQQFDWIYFDPPYDSYLYLPVLKAISALQLVTPEGAIAVEYNPKIWQAKQVPELEMYRTTTYGNTSLSFYAVNVR